MILLALHFLALARFVLRISRHFAMAAQPSRERRARISGVRIRDVRVYTSKQPCKNFAEHQCTQIEQAHLTTNSQRPMNNVG
jgi:hypothetical protein